MSAPHSFTGYLKKCVGFSIVYITMVFSTTHCSISCDIPACESKVSLLPETKMFSINGEFLPFKGRAYLLKPPNGTECYMNLTLILNAYNFTDEPVVAILAYECRQQYKIHMSDYSGESLKHIWFYFQIQGCKTSFRSLNRLSTVVNLKTVTLPSKAFLYVNSTDCFPSNKIVSHCYSIYHMYSLWIAHSEGYPEQNLSELFQCSEMFPNMTELSVHNMSVTELPSDVVKKLPNLQSLEMPHCQLTLPPKGFPWAEHSVKLEGNVTMESYFLEHYANVFHVQLDKQHYRRILNLNYNKIVNLTNFEFKGKLQMIQLAGNKMTAIGASTFRHMDGIQHIDLSRNRLKGLPRGVFKGMSSLRHLALSSNLLSELDEGLFHDTTSLVYLTLGNNSITYLPKGLFKKLDKLKEIHLEENKLTTIEASSFLITSTNLKMLYFDKNPLKVIPDIVFYLRHLEAAYLRNTLITFKNLTEITSRVSWSVLVDAVIESASSANIDLNKPPDKLRKVDLRGSKITTVWMPKNLSEFQSTFLLLVLRHFHFVIQYNSVICDCNIVTFTRWLRSLVYRGLLKGSEYFFREWICMFPTELRGKHLTRVLPKDTYCVVNVTSCPSRCACYKRTGQNIIIVDCRGIALREMPRDLPDGTLDLWFQYNNITVLDNKPYIPRVRQLLLSYNNLEVIESSVIKSFYQLQVLHLDSNLLATLPREFENLKQQVILLKNNPFRCDCKTLWMKQWILEHQSNIPDWTKVACNSHNEDGKQFVGLPDKEFICVEDFDSIKHVVTPAVSSSISVALFLVGLSLLYVYRLEVKVLLYIYFGIHPFDRDEKGGKEEIDALVVHSPDITDWVMKNVVTFLEKNVQNYVVCEITRDFVAGFSYQENIVSIVRRSKRMILVLSDEMTDTDDLFKVAWKEAQEKIKELRTNYVIVIGHNFPLKKLTNKDLKRYLKRGRFINTSESLLHEKILYSMPSYKYTIDYEETRGLPDIRKCIQDMYDAEDRQMGDMQYDAFLAYGETDRAFAINELRVYLENNGYSLLIPDRDFPPGASKEENVLQAVDSCNHTLFIVSGEHLEDEWALFTFRSASEKSLRSKCNHLILLTANKEDIEIVDEEVKYHIKTQVKLDIHSEWFWERLQKALPLKREQNDEEQEENNDEKEGEIKKPKIMNGNTLVQKEKEILENGTTNKYIEENGSLILKAKLKELELEKDNLPNEIVTIDHKQNGFVDTADVDTTFV